MKSLIVCVAGVMVVSVVLDYGSAYAASISLSKRPSNINVLSEGGVGVATLGIVSSDFPSGKSGGLKKLLGIEWTTTSYPQNLNEQVKLCYYRPYNTAQQTCDWIQPNSSGTTFTFNDQKFGNGAGVIIYHNVQGGGARIGYPAGSDSVTFRYAD
ncbi:hypothetical protein [Pseudomonas nabeulensis]|uniref:hypothetical protein n=1 Tax=Pseudomonas nabeulensis TaxID=2293833 RepID=UPI001076B1FF|nr:hypothetical protein [Pseudomonas nabeulensis]